MEIRASNSLFTQLKSKDGESILSADSLESGSSSNNID
jgi:hypothetical protein